MGSVGKRRTPWLAAAAVSVVLVAGATIWQMTRGVDEAVSSPRAGTGEVVADPHMPPQVQVEMESEGVRVYKFADEGDGDTAVYYIVNPALEL
jgi:Rieske Fe-S protein